MESDRAERVADFNDRYRIVGAAAMRRAELEVIGADYGATSYTTKAQADQLGKLLELGPDTRLVDLGSGAGWPSVYLAKTTGCSAVLVDMPLEGLRVAQTRLEEESVVGYPIAASAGALPLADGVFDAVSGSDVFC